MLAGGKGINVSYVLKNLGFESTAFGFLAGFVGEEIRRKVAADGIYADFLTLSEGVSRINVKLKTSTGRRSTEWAGHHGGSGFGASGEGSIS